MPSGARRRESSIASARAVELMTDDGQSDREESGAGSRAGPVATDGV